MPDSPVSQSGAALPQGTLVRAERDARGRPSVRIGTLYGGAGYNVVVDFSLGSEQELERFIDECRHAWMRAVAMEPLDECMPGPDVNEWYAD